MPRFSQVKDSLINLLDSLPYPASRHPEK